MEANKAAQVLHKQVHFKIFWPGNKRRTMQALRAKPGESFTAEQIEWLVERVAQHVKTWFPGHEYSLVPLGPAQFNFVWEREKEPAIS